MKTHEEQYQQGKAYVERTHDKQVDGTFGKHQLAYAYCAGFEDGHNEGIEDSNCENELMAWIKGVKELRKLGKKVGLFVTADISLTYNRSSLTIFTLDENDRLDKRVFEANNVIQDNTTFKMGDYIERAREFIYKYAGESTERLEEKEKALTEELKATKKKLAKAKKLVPVEK